MTTTTTTTTTEPQPGEFDVNAWHRRLCRVTEHLWLSGDLHESPERAIEQLHEWQAAGVTHILDCRIEYSDRDLVSIHAPEISYLHLGADDDDGGQEQHWFDAGVAWVTEVLADANSNVLVHCHMGVNRAPSMVFAILLSTGWEVQAALDRIVEARPIAAILYAADALHWHQERSTRRDPERESRERELVDAWVDRRRAQGQFAIERIRATEADLLAVGVIGRDDLAQAISVTTPLSLPDAVAVFDALEQCVLEALANGDAVDFPGIGPLDALGDEQGGEHQPERILAMLDLATEVSQRSHVAESAVAPAIVHMAGMIEEALDEGGIVYLPVLGPAARVRP